ncbi:MAG: hypothetical protein WDO18_22960 [Acidobacteriota bacterium]
MPFRDAVAESWRQNKENALMLYKFLQGIVEQRMSPKSIDGPLRIAQLSGEAAREGATSVPEPDGDGELESCCG